MSKFAFPERILPQLPDEVRKILLSAPEAEYATLTKNKVPINNPLFHYFGQDGKTIDVATGLAYPAKAERARRHPKIGLLFAPGLADQDPVLRDSPVTTGNDPVALVSAIAAVRDSDIQANTDRYVREWIQYHSNMIALPWDEEKERVWYYARIWVECQPVKILWWPNGILTGEKPREWLAPRDLQPIQSDPAPESSPPRPNKWPSPDWREVAAQVVKNIARPTLTLADEDEFPLPFPTLDVKPVDEGFEIDLPPVLPWQPEGPACLTFSLVATFLGRLETRSGRTTFVVEKLIGNLPLAGNDKMPEESVEARERLMRSLQAELERRGQVLPAVRRPED